MNTVRVFSSGWHHYLNAPQVTGGVVQFYYFGENRPDVYSREWIPIAGFKKTKRLYKILEE